MLFCIRTPLGIVASNGDPRIKVNRKPSANDAVATQQAKCNSGIGLPKPAPRKEANNLIKYESYDTERESTLNSIQHGELLQNNQGMC